MYIDIKEQRGQYWLENIMKDRFAVSMFGQKRLSREGGIEIVVKELCTRIARDGCQVTCYNRSGHHVSGAEYDNKIEYDGIRQKFVPTIERKGLAAVSSSFFAALYSAFGKYDVVHIHAEGPAFFSWLPKMFGKRVVVTIHGIDWQREKWKSGFGSKFIRQGEKNAVKYADEIIVLSKGVQDYFRDTYVFRNYYLYLIVAIVSQITNNIITSIIVSKMYPDYYPKGKLDANTVGSINGRIKDLFIAKFGGVVLNSADTIVISAFLGLTLLAVYQNYYFVMSSVCGIMEILLTSITAGLGNSYITESKEKNYTDLKKITFMFFWLTGMCTSCFLGIFQPFMRLWVGEKFLMGFSVVVCLCVYFYLYETTRLLNVFKNAGGIWHEDRFRPLISAIVNLALNLISVNYIGIYGIVLSTIVALAVIEIPWLLQNIFTVMYDTSLFKDYFKMFVSWIIATVFSGVIIAVLTYKVTFSGWGAFAFFVVVSVLIPNIVFLLLMHKTEEFKLSISMVNRITHNKLPIIKNL